MGPKTAPSIKISHIDGGFYGIDLKQIKSKAFSAVSGPDGSALQYKKKFTKIRVPGGPYGGPKVAPRVSLCKKWYLKGGSSRFKMTRFA